MTKQRVRREDLKPDEVLCDYCTAKCCKYFALPVDTPDSIEDYQHMRWYMMHGDVSFFVEDETWYLMVHADCKHLLPDNRCGIYETRPTVCRTYSTNDCEYDDDACYDKLFESPEQLWEYAEAVFPQAELRRKVAKRHGVSAVQLPVLSVVGED